jgi:hypothetical protein
VLKSESTNSHDRPGVRPTRSSTSGSKQSKIDEQALSLRETNMSYAAIARKLKLTRAVDAHKAFIRAVLSRRGDEQPGLVANERARLDKLEVHIRERDAADPDRLQRMLRAVARLRAALP